MATGDLGYLDDDDNLYVTGRAKEMTIRGGHSIDPVLIEEALSEHPAVAPAAAVWSGHCFARELDAPHPGDVPFKRELVLA